jgi:alpha-L-fucosidase
MPTTDSNHSTLWAWRPRRSIVLGCASVLLLLGAAVACCDAAKGAYEASWASLQHEPSEWMLDAKFGIYTHWGVYSVPAFETEWYAKRMYDEKSRVHKHHAKTYGDPKEFGYRKLVPLFKAENWDPAEWAQLMKASGARYAGMAVVHHDGFLLWDSDINQWNAKNMGPKRDCFGEYTEALRQAGLKTIATFHHIRTFNWYLPGVGGLGGAIKAELADKIKAQGWDLTDPQYQDLYWNELGAARYADFLAEWQAKVREVASKYRPDVLWFDGGSFREGDSERIVLELLAYCHNQADAAGKSIEVLNKLPVTGQFNFPREYGILTFEEGRDRLGQVEWPWIDDMKISDRAWCYIEGQTYKSANEIIDGLVDRVARGGGLLLNFSPKADGTVPAAQKETLLGVGRWLKTNGEAIYGTRPWKVAGEGDEGRLRSRQWKFGACDASDIRFTRSKDGRRLYAIVLGWPKNGKLRITTLGRQTLIAEGGIHKVTLLGSPAPLSWTRDAIALHVTLPESLDRDLPAYVLQIEPSGKLSLD